MGDYELLLGGKENAYKEFNRYRLSAAYYLAVLIVVLFLVVNFLSYAPEGDVPVSSNNDFKPPNNMIQTSDDDVTITTTQNIPSTTYSYLDLPTCDLSKDSGTPTHDVKEIIREFQRCASMILMRFVRNPEGLLFNWPYTIYVCDEEEPIMKIPLKSLDNGEKQYWALPPKCQEETTLVTLGVGENTKSEEELQTMVPNLTTVGTNPFLKQSKFYGQFYHVALSNNETTLQMNKTESEDVAVYNVTTVDQLEFFKETLSVKKIDMLWINPEAGNFEYWKYLNLDGKFDKLGIKVCQLNIEVTKESAEQWSKLINPLVKEQRYIFMRPMSTQGGNVTRTFFLNVKDPECVRKYLQ